MLLLFLAFLVGASSAFCPDVFGNQTACTCANSVDGAIVKCSGPGGPLVVEKLKKSHVEIRELTLENANIVEIGSRAFKNLRIKKLVLDKNRIKAFHKNAFDGLQNVLQELSINHNRLTEVPTAALSGLRALNVLNLRCNRIQDLEKPVFENMPSLIDINLSCNQICAINETSFGMIRGSLQSLTLDNNCLTKFPAEAIQNMENLIALHIKTNLINELEANSLSNLTSLSMLFLTGNNISTISPEAVLGCPNLRYVYLAENAISGFLPGAMTQFTQAQVIDLSFNNLNRIDEDTFAGLESLQHINLESNAITEIAPGAFSGTPLLLLWLPNNCVSNVTGSMFQGTPFLRQVSLANNNIENIEPLSFAHLANLHTLDLSFNRIRELRNNAITGSDHLTVRLPENPMVCEEDGFHVMNGNEAINLTTEPNVICQGDWKKPIPAVCPKNIPRPVPQPCCQKDQGRAFKMPSTTTPAVADESDELEYEEGSGDEATIKPYGPKVTPVADVPLTKASSPSTALTTTAKTTPVPVVHRKMKEETVLTEEDDEDEEKANEKVEEEIEEEYEEDEEEPEPSTTTTAAHTTTAETSTIPSVTRSPIRKVNMERFWRLAHRPSNAFEEASKKAHSRFLAQEAAAKPKPTTEANVVDELEEDEEEDEFNVEETTKKAEEVEFSEDAEQGEEYEEEGEAEEEYEEEEEEATTTTTQAPPRRIPARLLNRQRLLPPWMRVNKPSKGSSVEFSQDETPSVAVKDSVVPSRRV